MNEMQRFLTKVQKTDDCWIWVGAKKPSGYGNFYAHGKYMGAHCAAYLLYKGEIGDGLCVCHRCDNPSCVNPDHLFLGTAQANMDDMRAKGRWVCGNKRLSDQQCLEIVDLRKSGKSLKQIASVYLCSEANVSLIARGLSRGDVAERGIPSA